MAAVSATGAESRFPRHIGRVSAAQMSQVPSSFRHHVGQDADAAGTTRYAVLQRQLGEVNRKIAALVAAVESGVAVEELKGALSQRSAERDELKAQLERTERPHVMTAAERV